ncbi:hypothetical protein [Magnetospira sp. QH-2]|uniref:hypothetical protein n=1 Tax=Magnetospira sp. (strain QH-2) TaxID=1288970 RepID=UPI0003E81BC5|nr:hypothetical protein [Magnetospira sp. QH-2]CCQ75285.1 membrane protein of unknown function [Magnetospira sp. QH-2]
MKFLLFNVVVGGALVYLMAFGGPTGMPLPRELFPDRPEKVAIEQPAPEPVRQRIARPVAEPVIEPTPVMEPVAKPIAQPQPVSQPVPQPVPMPDPQPIPQALPQALPQAVPQKLAEPVVEPAHQPAIAPPPLPEPVSVARLDPKPAPMGESPGIFDAPEPETPKISARERRRSLQDLVADMERLYVDKMAR